MTQDWQGRRVVVTGAAGLLGSLLARRLSELGADVVGFDIDWRGEMAVDPGEGVRRVEGDVRDASLVARAVAESDTVFHLAAQALVGPANENPVPTFEANITGSWVVLEACRQAGVRSVVAASSDKAYGDHGGRPYEESMELKATHPYPASKACADLIAQTYANTYGLPVGVSRCGNLYGGGDRNWSRLIPGTIRSVLQGSRPVIRSDGSHVRDYLYVGDAAEGLIALAGALATTPELAGEAFNFGAEERHTVSEVVSRILEVVGSDLEPDVRADARNEIHEQRVDARKAGRILRWAPRFSLEQGLKATIDWYRANL